MTKKNILLLTTGGTIACAPGSEGLEPQKGQILERELERLRSFYDITVKDQPAHGLCHGGLGNTGGVSGF